MKLNCDMGESFGSWTMGQDSAVMPFIDMASIACGFHASDPLTMERTVKLARNEGVTIGAHPGYPDLLGFGRRAMKCEADELKALVVYQIAALEGICRANGCSIEYVKPHGALYNTMMVDEEVLHSVMAAVHSYAPHCPLVVMATPDAERIQAAGRELGLEVWFEAFSDRAYDDHGRLVSRTQPGAVHHSSDAIQKQVLQILEEGTVTTNTGKKIPIQADTICIHGDNPEALEAARRIRKLVSAS